MGFALIELPLVIFLLAVVMGAVCALFGGGLVPLLICIAPFALLAAFIGIHVIISRLGSGRAG
jgi:hypothetical protein